MFWKAEKNCRSERPKNFLQQFHKALDALTVNVKNNPQTVGGSNGSAVGTPAGHSVKAAGTEGGGGLCEALLPFQRRFIDNDMLRPGLCCGESASPHQT